MRGSGCPGRTFAAHNDAHVQVNGSGPNDPGYHGDDTTPTVLYTLHDHNANVIGLADAVGRLVAQYAYTPYGELRAAELLNIGSDSLAFESTAAARGNRLGHQGLRAERLDRPWDGAMELSSADTSSGGTGVYRALYFNRNRMYEPGMGRFLENDPKALGQPVLSTSVFRGAAPGVEDTKSDIVDHFGNGMNTHVTLGGSPLGRQDALGLEWDSFDVVDDFVAEHAASQAAFFANLRQGLRSGFNTTLHIAWQLAQLNPAIGTAVALYNIANSLQHGETPSLWDIAGALPAVGVIGREAASLARSASYLSEANQAYAVGSKAARVAEASAAVDRAIGATGRIGEEFLATLGGTAQKFFRTSTGSRFVDRFVNGVAHESKVGYVTHSGNVIKQVEKDAELLATNPEVKEVVWHFFKSPVTGQGGPSAPLREALLDAGIRIIEH